MVELRRLVSLLQRSSETAQCFTLPHATYLAAKPWSHRPSALLRDTVYGCWSTRNRRPLRENLAEG